jgi:nitrite reductase/ring-hydroxylating ferredoxin subunit/uncharacterized membrane protein
MRGAYGFAVALRGNERRVFSLRLARRAANATAVLDPVSDVLQGALRALPRPLRDVLDGTWFEAPLHPALTDVPIGTWTAAVVLDSVAPVARDEEALASAAEHALAIGVLAAVPTALTGANDWSHLRGDSKRIGTLHALLNSTALGLNVASLVLRRSGRRDAGRALSGIAFAGTLVSAHLGGQLSFGLGVRVNRTAFESPPDEWRPVLPEAELAGDELRRVEADGLPVLLTRSRSGRLCAIAATCTHLGGPLDEGERDGDVVVCPWHGSRFDVCSGEVEAGPAVFPQPAYESRVRDGTIELRRVENT